ncbi:redoxin family protein [Flammeovirga yaeyamensis]|uniref:Redoxin family protein n=1 Tax=Flammeovirga yaeyamensis TaxID=367791 RepID=A0AAX1N6X1_9BACT|nr:TlpA disulfide reductase family protein [Flammeovirga yaeyamensis]MBB3697589.1 thiol-disulfide isomerase/thioredoxin [Flammeovirga yaeyamensis]NMF36279.1 TlpA family protein disulfide reductase [Flammeovirga yaeyamensis]QWG03006.1 redoxin family protein [Flammeovirga yaeyamensis]
MKKLFSWSILLIATFVLSSNNSPNKDKDKLYIFEDLNGNKVNLKDYKGKLVYIDVWASWCGPCLKEIPSLQKIEEEYKDKDIVFVSVSADQSKDAWKKMVEKKELHGNQFHLGGNYEFTDKFQITGIPRFILLGKDCKVIEANAPRPSEEALKMLFEEQGI